MKALVLAAVLAALSSSTPAGATREARQPIVDTTTAAVIADAGRLGSASLTSLNANSPWTQPKRQVEADYEVLPAEVDTGTLLIALGVAALALVRPVSRALRRQEQQRRATALASSIAHTPR